VFAFVDILGPCRELFGNLLSDFVETLAFVRDFPGARFVEPSIANAVWRRFKPSQQEVDDVMSGRVGRGIYSFWTPETACGLNHTTSTVTSVDVLYDQGVLRNWLARAGVGWSSWNDFLRAKGQPHFDLVLALSFHTRPNMRCRDKGNATSTPFYMQFLRTRFSVQQVVCVQSGAHHLDVAKAHAAVRRVCPKIKRCHVGLFFYWIEDQERLRMHPFRYKLTHNVHPFYASAWEALEWAPDVLKYVPAVAQTHGSYLAAHWRRGDWYLGPHHRKLEQATLSTPEKFAALLYRGLAAAKVDTVFLMTNGNASEVAELRRFFTGKLVLPPVVSEGVAWFHRDLKQLAVEMAIAANAKHFIGFGDDGSSHASMPSVIVQMYRAYRLRLPAETVSWSFRDPENEDNDYMLSSNADGAMVYRHP